MSHELASYFYFWGKARPNDDAASLFHPLPCHCLDVAGVASAWWSRSAVIRTSFCRIMQCDEDHARAWVLFFIALHDYGKLDIRFQAKAPEALQLLRPDISTGSMYPEKDYSHGPAGYGLFFQVDSPTLGFSLDQMDCWQYWFAAVAGHHGTMPLSVEQKEPFAAAEITECDRTARREWLADLESLFLSPIGLSIKDLPPTCPDLMAGFCAVCDWLGSDADIFRYQPLESVSTLDDYWQVAQSRSLSALDKSGLARNVSSDAGMGHLFPEYVPRQLQTVVDSLPVEPTLTIVEAPTGSGKTEAALAQASRLMAAGIAESVIFALPTQATSNAMYGRLETIAGKLFCDGTNLLLAHGKAKYHDGFEQLKRASERRTAQGVEDASVQCVRWLSGSRKRVFLGQIGVCTIDQVLMSVLPAKHQFVRAFGLRKSVLIIDEVHAYDAYMYGLLKQVLKGQHAAGAPVILLSATLPAHQKAALMSTWKARPKDGVAEQSAYPLISTVSAGGNAQQFEPEEAEKPQAFSVDSEIWPSQSVLPGEQQCAEMVQAAESGALVGIVCNLVTDAQALYEKLKALTNHPVDLFHARYRFVDRQHHEIAVMKNYGRDASRQQGRILVATQVIEQSLDLDFDWLITQICPADLLFQRIGRLHRHPRKNRPHEFANPKVTVLVPDSADFGLHAVVYGCRRFLWRTLRLLEGNKTVAFPSAYRPWIESVYREDAWPDEPAAIQDEFDRFSAEEMGRHYCATRLSKSSATPWEDTEGVAARLTRDGDMNLSVVLVQRKNGKTALLDGRTLDELDDAEWGEVLDLNTVGVPASWKKVMPRTDEEGRVWLEMVQVGEVWECEQSEELFGYDEKVGLTRQQ